jgi:hypothetical protein
MTEPDGCTEFGLPVTGKQASQHATTRRHSFFQTKDIPSSPVYGPHAKGRLN